ncbi:MAG: site-specific DNA-methyltransferase [Gammaproteobacteria bacterium]|nr:site-specific DNA-methyltransferase [Gammaproteobacteria bacterium]
MPTLDWLNRAHAFTTAAQVPYRLLENVSTHGDAASAQGNLLIQGDNLEALKALLPFYRGQVKCIFIDPPYNTKSAFEHYDDNLEHSQWLSMMLPRLQLLRDLLSDDGSIWVTIDDNEGHYLKVLMDEVFGRGNFVANVLWQKKYAVANDHKTIAPMHDHVLVYRKTSAWQRNLLPRTDEKDRQYKNEDEKGIFRVSDYTCPKTAEERPNLFYPITQPNTGAEIWPSRTRVWAYSLEEHRRHVADGFIYWGKDGQGKTPAYKRYKHLLKNDGVVPQTWWAHDFAGHTDGSRKEAREVLGTTSLTDDFITPKPELLISRILQTATNPGDLVLDSFLGSGTTAAVAHKMGRRWIGIEMGEHAATHCLPRLQKVIDGEQGGISQAVNWQGGGGFRFQRLGAPIFDADGCIHPEVRFATLAAFVWQQETGTAFDPARATPGTPHLGTHSVFDSYERLPDGRLGPISSETLPPAPSAPQAQGELGLQAPDALPPPAAAPAPVLRSRTAYYLLFNGILGDKRPASGNVLTSAVLDALLELHARTPHPEAPLVVYGEACRLGEARLALARVTFKHIPYDVKAR